MSTRVVERVEEWTERSFDGGYRELQDLADREFSGVVRAGGAELYMTKGIVVGIRHGSIESFEDASGTAYEAPTPALPLLAVMQERSDEVRGQYYTEDTPVSEVDRTLSDGGFTGFVELSENVLSGDYYLVYHQGRSMSVAFVGNAARLLDGDEAFERADGEVGIYEVRPVSIEPVDIPEPTEPEPQAGAAVDDASATPDEPDGESETEEAPPAQDGSTDAGTEASAEGASAGADEPGGGEPEAAGDDTAAAPGESATEATADEAATGETAAGETTTGETAADEAATGETAAGETTDGAETGDGTASEGAAGEEGAPETERDRADPAREDPAPAESDGQTAASSADAPAAGEQVGDRAASEPAAGQNAADADDAGTGTAAGRSAGATEQPPGSGTTGAVDLETKAIPSLDPERTRERPSDAGTEAPGAEPRAGAQQAEPAAGGPQQAEREPEPEVSERAGGTESDAEPEDDRLESLEAELAERDEEIQRLEGELEAAESEREQLEEQLETVREEREDLQAEVERLREQQEELEREFGAATDAERRMTPKEALDGTDVFVRYHSKGDATLENVHGGGARRTDVHENLRLEKHTQFDADTVSVGGRTYEEFLDGTIQYGFVRWIARELPFEIRDTGHTDGLSDLYDALPKIDRAELNGVVDVTYSEEGSETRSQESFDVVLRDRMGDPLVVANVNDSREAATESMMERLVTAAERVGQTSDGFAAAFLVTRSFFEPAALETASEATRGGLLSRDKRRSFVNLSRKRGYHLCLVEARNENFHLAVPEL